VARAADHAEVTVWPVRWPSAIVGGEHVAGKQAVAIVEEVLDTTAPTLGRSRVWPRPEIVDGGWRSRQRADIGTFTMLQDGVLASLRRLADEWRPR
jgi:hypothetical protein